MFRSLARLKSFIVPYQRRLGLGIGAFGVARLFEGFVPMFVALAIDRMSSGNPDMTLPVAGILGSVLGRYSFVTYAQNNLLIRPTKTNLSTTFEINATNVTVAAPVVFATDVVSVDISYPHEFIGLSLVNLSGITISSSSSLIVE